MRTNGGWWHIGWWLGLSLAVLFGPAGAQEADRSPPLAVPTESSTATSEPMPVTASLSSLTPALEEIFRRAPHNGEEIRLMEAHLRELAERVTPCVVGLQVGQAQGSGVIVSSDGLVLTAAHVAQRPGLDVWVIFADGRRVRGRTLGIERSTDAGMVKITPSPRTDNNGPAGSGDTTFPFVPVGDDRNLTLGEWVLTLGHHGGYQRGRKPPVRVGRVLQRSDNVIRTDCPLVGGDSGGPLFNMKGEVVGIHSRIGSSLAANMHVPAHQFTQHWDGLVEGRVMGEVPRGGPYIGVQGEPNSTEARIVEVTPGSPAEAAGIKAGDVIVEFGGEKVEKFDDLITLVAGRVPGERVKVVVQRGDERIELEVEIGRR